MCWNSVEANILAWWKYLNTIIYSVDQIFHKDFSVVKDSLISNSRRFSNNRYLFLVIIYNLANICRKVNSFIQLKFGFKIFSTYLCANRGFNHYIHHKFYNSHQTWILHKKWKKKLLWTIKSQIFGVFCDQLNFIFCSSSKAQSKSLQVTNNVHICLWFCLYSKLAVVPQSFQNSLTVKNAHIKCELN